MQFFKCLRQRSAAWSAGPEHRNITLFMLEGAVFTLASTFSSNTVNLFLTRLNASDFELGIYSTLTQLLGMIFLIPAAVYTDRLANKRKMVVALLVLLTGCFLMTAASPFAGDHRIGMLITTAALGAGTVTLFNSIWQAYFADVIPEEMVNRAYSARNRATFIAHTAAALVSGAILTSVASVSGKITTHQIYFVFAAALTLLQIGILMKIKGGNVKYQSGKSMKDLKEAVVDLARNKRFLFFAAVAVLFYITWRMDGTIFYLGQVKYVGLSEFWLNASMAACTTGQVLSVGFWAKLNEKMGCRFGIIFGALGLVISPACIIVPLSFEGGARIAVHLVLRFISDIGFTTVSLNFLQNLLQVIPEKNRALSIAVYTTLITIVSSFMPLVGVEVYTALGANEQAMVSTFLIMGALRVVSLGGLIFRWAVMRKEPK